MFNKSMTKVRRKFDYINNIFTYAPTVHTALPIKTASQGVSFAFYIIIQRRGVDDPE
jgi:hypothetical protein